MDNKRPWWLPDTKGFIAIFIVGAFVTAVFVWMLFPPTKVDQAALTVINMLLGALVAKFGTVVDFNFGSSQGSKDKDDAQNKMVEKMVIPPNSTAPITTTTTTPESVTTETKPPDK